MSLGLDDFGDHEAPVDFIRGQGGAPRIADPDNPEKLKTVARWSALGDTLDDKSALTNWRIDRAMDGMASKPELVAKVLAAEEGDRPTYTALREEAINAGRGRIVGMEGELAVQLPAGISIGGDVTWAWGDYEDPEEGRVPASRIPPLFGNVRLRADPPVADLFVELYSQWSGAQDRLSPRDVDDPRIPDGGTPGWWTLNVRAGVVPTDWLVLTAGAANLTDAAYKTHGSGVYAPGIDLWIAAEITAAEAGW